MLQQEKWTSVVYSGMPIGKIQIIFMFISDEWNIYKHAS